MNPQNLTSVLQTIFDDIDVASLSLMFPFLAPVFKIPVVGTLLSDGLNWVVNSLIKNGVIDLKVGLINFLSSSAQTKYAAFMPTLLQIQGQPAITPEQLSAYENLLQNAIENHKSVATA